jgi:hypothetical protein
VTSVFIFLHFCHKFLTASSPVISLQLHLFVAQFIVVVGNEVDEVSVPLKVRDRLLHLHDTARTLF